jgi:acyl carrier protein
MDATARDGPISAAAAVAAALGAVARRSPEAIRAEHRLAEDLGLDSLSFLEMAELIEATLGIRIDDAALAACATVGELAATVSAAARAGRT